MAELAPAQDATCDSAIVGMTKLASTLVTLNALANCTGWRTPAANAELWRLGSLKVLGPRAGS